MPEKFFAVGLNEHRLWGYILVPQMLKKSNDKAFYTPEHPIQPNEEDGHFQQLSPGEKEIVRLIDEYNEQQLFKLFSKEKSLKEFQQKLQAERFQKFIRPYIEKRIAIIFDLMRGSKVRMFMRDKTRSNVFEDDFLTILREEAEPVFNFRRMEEGSRYSLDIYHKNQKIPLQSKSCEILVNHPAIIRVDHYLMKVREIEAKKIQPFFSKDHIIIPSKTETEYFKKFVTNIVRQYEVNAEGFEINKIIPERNAFITLSQSINNLAFIILSFSYKQKRIMANSPQKVFVDFHQKSGDILYDKYERDETFETFYHNLLNDMGLISYDQVNYEIKNNRSKDFDQQLYEMVEWINSNEKELLKAGLTLEQKAVDKQYFLGNREFIIKSELDNDWFDIHALVILGEFRIPFPSFKDHILAGIREFTLPDESIFVIPQEWFARFKELFEFAHIKDQEIRVHKQHFSVIEKAEEGLSQKYIEQLKQLNRRDQLPSVPVPENLTTQLRSYQVEGYVWLYYLQQNNLGGCLADDMGLGKTIQAISVLLRNKEDMEKEDRLTSNAQSIAQPDLFGQETQAMKTSLIIVPASLVHNWLNEFKRFAPTLKVYSFVGNQRKKDLRLFQDYDLVISSYHTIRQDIDMLVDYEFHYIVLDESHVIKNPSSKLYKAIMMLNSKYRLALTGTPIENSLTDLWAQMNFVNNGLLGNLSFFRREFVSPIEKHNDEEKEERLRALINPFILRRRKEEVARELPEITDQIIYCNMTDEQRRYYEEEKSSIRNYIFENIEKEGIDKSSFAVLQGLTRLRQISNHPLMVDEEYAHESGKFNEIIRNIENIILEDHKVLIFSSFVKHLKLIRERLEKLSVDYTMLTGASTKREDLVNAFQENPDCKVFLISIKAGGTGLNLTAADYVFILDPWWNPATEEQAINRAHRIGQDKNVFVFRFISENSIEEKIQQLQERKSRLAESFVNTNNPMKDITQKDLEELFG